MKYIVDLLTKPCLSINEAGLVLGLSHQTIRRRISEGRLKIAERQNEHEKLLIFTDSIIKMLKGDKKSSV